MGMAVVVEPAASEGLVVVVEGLAGTASEEAAVLTEAVDLSSDGVGDGANDGRGDVLGLSIRSAESNLAAVEDSRSVVPEV
jgi:hypothetical protein